MIAAGLVSPALILACCVSGPTRMEVRHPNGTVARAGLLVDGLQQGEWTFWYPNGARMSQGSYERDARTSAWTHWYENGAMRMRGSYRGERQQGPWEYWHENGARHCTGEFEDGRERGEWAFFHATGKEQQRGCFLDGRRQLQWTECGPDGALSSVGSYLDDVPVGTWRRFAPGGNETLLEYPLPDGVEHVLETWDGGGVRREGFLRGGKPDGLWITRHENGALRALAAFVAGECRGNFEVRTADGSLLARGPLTDGQPCGAWLVRGPGLDGGLENVVVQPEGRMPWDRQWSQADVADRQPPIAVAVRWLQELGSPPTVQPRPAATPAAPAPVEASSARPEAPTDPGAWTVRELDELETLRRYYRDGWLPRQQSIGERYGSAPGSRRLGNGDAGLATSIVGQPLPVTTFPTADGTQLDLATLRGKRVLLVVLRGFTTQVCVYCFAQTTELAPLAPRWAQLDCEVVVLFPGAKSRLDAFVAACNTEFAGEQPPYRLVYDPDLALAKALGLQGNLARPSSFVIDREGKIAHAYVAESEQNIADRPAASELLALVAATP